MKGILSFEKGRRCRTTHEVELQMQRQNPPLLPSNFLFDCFGFAESQFPLNNGGSNNTS